MNLRNNPVKCEQVIDFMQKLISNQHAEIVPKIPVSLEGWYIPMLAVYHPKKPDSVRVVFDSSAKFQDVSLNNVLLQGPDLCNSLLGILLRFRRDLKHGYFLLDFWILGQGDLRGEALIFSKMFTKLNLMKDSERVHLRSVEVVWVKGDSLPLILPIQTFVPFQILDHFQE